MRHFAASNMDPAALCEREVRESDVYVAIVGLDYGTPVPGRPELSYTQLEFETATRLQLPRLVFLGKEEALPPPRDTSSDLLRRQQAFRESLQKQAGLTVAWFGSPDELDLQVFQALGALDRVCPHARGRRQARLARRLIALAWALSLLLSLIALAAHVYAAPGWTALGAASTDPLGAATLTPQATLFRSGAVYWTTPIQPSRLRVAFDATFDQGRGYGPADGMAFDILDADYYSEPVLGDVGASVGFGGLIGDSVALIENHTTRYACYGGASHFVGVADGEVPPATEIEGGRCPLNYLATASAGIPDFYDRTTHVDIEVTFGRSSEIRVSLDSRLVLDFRSPVPLPTKVFVGFSAGTGAGSERQLVDNAQIQYSPAPPVTTCGGAARTRSGAPRCAVPVGLWQWMQEELQH
jgi:hypothetical protein